MVRSCVAGGCNSANIRGVKLYKWPKDAKAAKQWTEFVKRTRLEWDGPSKWSALCSTHFEADSFELMCSVATEMGRKKKLKPTAVPRIKKPQVINMETDRDDDATGAMIEPPDQDCRTAGVRIKEEPLDYEDTSSNYQGTEAKFSEMGLQLNLPTVKNTSEDVAHSMLNVKKEKAAVNVQYPPSASKILEAPVVPVSLVSSVNRVMLPKHNTAVASKLRDVIMNKAGKPKTSKSSKSKTKQNDTKANLKSASSAAQLQSNILSPGIHLGTLSFPVKLTSSLSTLGLETSQSTIIQPTAQSGLSYTTSPLSTVTAPSGLPSNTPLSTINFGMPQSSINFGTPQSTIRFGGVGIPVNLGAAASSPLQLSAVRYPVQLVTASPAVNSGTSQLPNKIAVSKLAGNGQSTPVLGTSGDIKHGTLYGTSSAPVPASSGDMKHGTLYGTSSAPVPASSGDIKHGTLYGTSSAPVPVHDPDSTTPLEPECNCSSEEVSEYGNRLKEILKPRSNVEKMCQLMPIMLTTTKQQHSQIQHLVQMIESLEENHQNLKTDIEKHLVAQEKDKQCNKKVCSISRKRPSRFRKRKIKFTRPSLPDSQIKTTGTKPVSLKADVKIYKQYVRPDIEKILKEIQKTKEKRLSLSHIEGDSSLCKKYTGIPNYSTFKALFYRLVAYDSISSPIMRNKKGDAQFNLENELFLTLVKIKLNLPVTHLSRQFKVRPGVVREILYKWTPVLIRTMEKLKQDPEFKSVTQFWTLLKRFKQKVENSYM